MEKSMLGQANLDKLKPSVVLATSAASPQDEVLSCEDLASEFSQSPCKEDLHDAVLRLYARLCKLFQPQASEEVDQVVSLDHMIKPVSSPGHVHSPLADTESLHKLANSLVKCLSIFPAEIGVGTLHASDYSDCALLAEASLASLVLVSHLNSDLGFSFNDQDLLSIVAYTDEMDPWTTSKSAEHAKTLLSRYLTDDRRADVIIKSLLQETIRPLFSRPSALLTASGRPSQFEAQSGKQYRHHHHDTPPWKKKGCFVISAFRFAVKSNSPELVASHWPLFLPVIVSLAEDENAFIREQGLIIMKLFLETCPPDLIRSTGIGNVFRDTVFPTLLFLPSLTPEQESVRLLRSAYRVLLKLAHIESALPSSQKQQLLDKMIRDGIYSAYTHASQHVRIVQVLMDATEAIVKCMGVFTVKHLQNLLRLFASIMTDPFATLYPPAIISAAKALGTTLINCWPRSFEDPHMESAINTIVRCWLNMDQHDADHNDGEKEATSRLSNHDRDAIRQSLVTASKALQSMWKQQRCGPPRKLQDLLQREPQLVGLFGET